MKEWLVRFYPACFMVLGLGVLGSPLGSIKLAYCENKNATPEVQLKALLIDAQKNLGDLEPWQKVIFSEEVVPQYQRFFRDYKASQNGIQADIDLTSLKNYLAYYGPKAFNQKSPRVLVYLSADTECSKCKGSFPIVQKLAKSRLERRGFIPTFLTLEEVAASPNKSLEMQLSELVKLKKTAGYLLIQWGPLATDDTDTAHADENHYSFKASLSLGEASNVSREKELLENDPFETAEARLLSDIFTEFGSKLEGGKVILPESNQEEVGVEVTGIQDYFHYVKVKGIIQNKFKDQAIIEDRKISRGRFLFAVRTRKTAADVKRDLSEINFTAEGVPTVSAVVK